MAFVRIGETTALIPEAGSAVETQWQEDGKSGNTQFPYGVFKALATVGEVDPARVGRKNPASIRALTGVPDGSGAWLLDDDTVRVAYQSESQGSIWTRTPAGQTYPQTMKSGVTFTGSKLHFIDYDREGLSTFLEGESSAAPLVKNSGLLFNKLYNVFGKEVAPPSSSDDAFATAWGNQVKPNGRFVDFVEGKQPSEADFMFNSFCGSWYEPANKWGDGRGFVDNIWLNSEEWNVARRGAFGDVGDTKTYTTTGDNSRPWKLSGSTMGLASLITDVDSRTAYTAPALGQTGYEKMVPLNPQSEDYVVIALSGYNFFNKTSPVRLYVGLKGYGADGEVLDVDNASNPEQFLARNGLLHGQIYGLAVNEQSADRMSLESGFWGEEAGGGAFDDYQESSDAVNRFSGRFYPSGFKWDGFDEPVAVRDTEMLMWTQPEHQPAYDADSESFADDGYFFLNGSYKMEHSAPDPDPTRTRYAQNMTGNNAILGFDLTKIERQLRKNDRDGDRLPDFLNVQVNRIVSGAEGSLVLDTGDQGLAHQGEFNPDGLFTAATHLGDGGVERMEDPDGLAWIKGSDGDVLIVDEDSGNEYGERKFVLPIDSTMNLRDEASGYFLAMAGGEYSPRTAAEASALGDTFYLHNPEKSDYTDAEFSSSWDLTGLLARKQDGSFYTKAELEGRTLFDIQEAIPLDDHALMGVVQKRGEAGGQVEELQADGGGQLLMFNIDYSAMA